ncbi:3-oxoacyl-ACP synthase III family protein [Nocardioides plantarum]|uniref:3-oxoacyl-ACP synthase III family protein n=1 Tax=Nocardioides plantarum TaxID=29299 RepID=A0ABV5KAP3_9ACTN|nr:ketoacyl-ACP synthase III [Nocardioides plantarum]
MKTGIIGTGAALPPRVVDNEELARDLTVTAAWIGERTGVRERRYADIDVATSDLATRAAVEALADAGLSAADLDLIVVGTSTPDQPQPATGCLVQRRLGAVNAAAFDVNSVCTSFVFALDAARSMLEADPRRRFALVLGADTYSRIVDPADHRSSVLFGDGAGAVVLGPVPEDEGVLTTTLRSDGHLSHLVEVRGGGSREPLTARSLAAGADRFTMRGREVRDYVEEVVPAVLADLLKDAGLDLEDIDHVVPHQANARLLRSCFAEHGITGSRLHLTCPTLGNTAAASIPLTLHDAVTAGRIAPGDLVALVGVGGGMSAGGALVRWSRPGAGVVR